MPLPYQILDVFTSTPFLGNPLAIVTLPPNTPLSTGQKQSIAKEFNLSETVFVHDIEHHDIEHTARSYERHFDIFTPRAELPFAGHPTIGTAVHLYAQGVTTLIAKAGRIDIEKTEGGALRAAIPHDVRLHQQRLPLALPTSASNADDTLQLGIASAETNAPLFSIVNGMTFALIELPSLEHLSAVRVGVAPDLPVELLDEGWRGGWSTRRYYYVVLDREEGENKATYRLRTRMVKTTPAMEDPATGSAACALGGYLSLCKSGARAVRFEIMQGVEMGRESRILIDTCVGQDGDGARRLQTVHLGGTAVQVASGTIAVPT
jgi:PhzF family phenazine biosynthesis protein